MKDLQFFWITPFFSTLLYMSLIQCEKKYLKLGIIKESNRPAILRSEVNVNHRLKHSLYQLQPVSIAISSLIWLPFLQHIDIISCLNGYNVCVLSLYWFLWQCGSKTVNFIFSMMPGSAHSFKRAFWQICLKIKCMCGTFFFCFVFFFVLL